MPQHVANHPGLPAATGLPEGYTLSIAGVLYRIEGGDWVAPSTGEGFDGRQVQLRSSGTHLQWRYEGDPVWLDLFALAELQGDPGDPGIGIPLGGTVGQVLTKTGEGDYVTGWQDPPAGTIGDGTAQDGREVELQVSATHIQWRYVGETWADLVALEDLRGPAGTGGTGAGIVFRGSWSGAVTDYTAGDVVHHIGFSWLAVRATTAEPVANGPDWVPLGALTAGTGSVLPPGGDPGQVLTRVGTDGAYWADVEVPVEDVPELPSIGGVIQAADLINYASVGQSAASITVPGIPAGASTLLIFTGYWAFSLVATSAMTVDGVPAAKIGGEWIGIGSGSSGRIMSVWRYDYPVGQTAPSSIVLGLTHQTSDDMLGVHVVALSGAGEMTVEHAVGIGTSTSLDTAKATPEQTVISAVAARATGMDVEAEGLNLSSTLNRGGNTLFRVALVESPTITWAFTGQDYPAGDNYVHVLVRIEGVVAQSPNEGRTLTVLGGRAAWVQTVMPIEERALTSSEGAIALDKRAATLLMATFAGAGRLRIYRTAVGRGDDLGRAVTTPYPGGRGLVYEYVATGVETTEHSGLNLTRLANEPGLYYHLSGAAVTLTIKEIA